MNNWICSRLKSLLFLILSLMLILVSVLQFFLYFFNNCVYRFIVLFQCFYSSGIVLLFVLHFFN